MRPEPGQPHASPQPDGVRGLGRHRACGQHLVVEECEVAGDAQLQAGGQAQRAHAGREPAVPLRARPSARFRQRM